MDNADQDNRAAQPAGILRGSIPELGKSPVHLLAAIVAPAADKLWDVMLLDMAKAMALPDKIRFFLLAGLLLLLLTTASAALTQMDDAGMALAKGLAMGILVGLPYSFGATELGLIFVGWSSINELQKLNQ